MARAKIEIHPMQLDAISAPIVKALGVMHGAQRDDAARPNDGPSVIAKAMAEFTAELKGLRADLVKHVAAHTTAISDLTEATRANKPLAPPVAEEKASEPPAAPPAAEEEAPMPSTDPVIPGLFDGAYPSAEPAATPTAKPAAKPVAGKPAKPKEIVKGIDGHDYELRRVKKPKKRIQGRVVAASGSVPPPTPVPPSNSIAPQVTGTPQVGDVLSTTQGVWNGDTPMTYTYQWQANAVNISGATASTFTLTSAQLTDNITCVVTAHNDAGSASATSNSVGPVVPIPSTWTLIVGSDQSNNDSPVPVNTTGANLFIMQSYGGGSPSDSAGNTWTSLVSSGLARNTLDVWYVANPTTSASHTFSSGGGPASTNIQAWSGAAAAPLDVVGTVAASVGTGNTTVPTGPITPTVSNALIVAAFALDDPTSTYSINDGFTITSSTHEIPGATYGGALAYAVQASPASINPTLTRGTAGTIGVGQDGGVLISFKPV